MSKTRGRPRTCFPKETLNPLVYSRPKTAASDPGNRHQLRSEGKRDASINAVIMGSNSRNGVRTGQSECDVIDEIQCKIKQIDLANYESLPDNPFVYVRKPKDQGTISRPGSSHSRVSVTSRPVSLVPYREQTARLNLEKYRLEQVLYIYTDYSPKNTVCN
jgi:hypothetical protein